MTVNNETLRPNLVLLCVLFLGVWTLGLWTVCPTVYWRDSPEFVDVVFTLGIPHPAGSPTYILLAKLWTFLPFANIAFRVNWVSVFWQSVSVLGLFIVTFELIGMIFPKTSSWRRHMAALLASINFGFSPSFWMVSNIAEVYSMNASFLLGIVWCSLRFWTRRDFRFLLGGAFLYGLSAGVHATVVFYLPAVVLLFAMGVPRAKGWSMAVRVSFFFLFGFSTYLYLAIRSKVNPTFDWGNPETFSQFLIHITDRKTKSNHFDLQLGSLWNLNFPRYFGHLQRELGWVGFAGTVVGFIFHARKERRFLLVLLCLALGNILFYLNWKTGDGFIPSNIVFTFWVGLCFTGLLNRLGRMAPLSSGTVRWDRVFSFACLFFFGYSMFVPAPGRSLTPFYYANKSHFYSGYETPRREYDQMDVDAMAITTLFWFPFRFFQDIERHRPDVSIVMASDVLAPRVFNPLTPNRFPKLNLPQGDPLSVPWHEYMPELINRNVMLPIYYEPNLTLVRPLFKNLRPQQILFKVIPGEKRKGLSVQEREAYLEGYRFLLSEEYLERVFEHDINSREYHMTFLLFCADYLLLHGHPAEARSFLQIAANIRPNQGTVEFYLGQTDLALGNSYEGIDRLQHLILREKNYGDPHLVLARYFMDYGDLVVAKIHLDEAEKKRTKDFRLGIYWVEFYWRLGELKRSRTELNSIVPLAQFDEDFESLELWQKILDEALDGSRTR